MKKTHVLLATLLFVIIFSGCQEESPYPLQILVILSPTANINSATIQGEIKSDLTEYSRMGICWDTVPRPTTNDPHVEVTDIEKNFTLSISGLLPGTRYYIRAFATADKKIAYSAEYIFNTKVADYQGNTYKTVTIGKQTWMAENLKVTRYMNGDTINTTTSGVQGKTEPKYQWAYDYNLNNAETYGRLYTWYAVVDARKICPSGWHVPSMNEMNELKAFIGGEDAAGAKLKERDTTHWNSPNTDATDEFGFSALPGGTRMMDGAFVSLGISCHLWSTSTETYNDNDWGMGHAAFYNKSIWLWGGYYKGTGKSVRCIKD